MLGNLLLVIVGVLEEQHQVYNANGNKLLITITQVVLFSHLCKTFYGMYQHKTCLGGVVDDGWKQKGLAYLMLEMEDALTFTANYGFPENYAWKL